MILFFFCGTILAIEPKQNEMKWKEKNLHNLFSAGGFFCMYKKFCKSFNSVFFKNKEKKSKSFWKILIQKCETIYAKWNYNEKKIRICRWKDEHVTNQTKKKQNFLQLKSIVFFLLQWMSFFFFFSFLDHFHRTGLICINLMILIFFLSLFIHLFMANIYIYEGVHIDPMNEITWIIWWWWWWY